MEEGDRADQIEHGPEKWTPVFRKDHAQTKETFSAAGSSQPARWPPHRRIDVQARRVELVRIVRRFQWRNRARAIALVATKNIGEDRGLVGILACRFEFERAAPGALLGRGHHEYLHVGLRTDDRADVASVEHGAGRHACEVALESQQRGAHVGDRRNDGRRFADGVAFQNLLIELFRIERARGRDRALLVVERLSGIEQRLGDRAIDQPGIEMAQPEMRREPLAERAFAGRRRSVDGDDHARFE